jgi:hypothetical protein
MLLYIPIQELQPSHISFQVAPDPLDRVQLRTVGRSEHEAHVGWDGEPLGGRRATVIQKEEVQAVGEGRREGLDEELEALGVEIRQFEEQPRARGRGHGTIDVAPCKDGLHRADGLHPAGREAAATHRQQAKAAFVLAEHPHWVRIHGRDDLLQPLATGRLEFPERLRVFWCDWAAAP